MTDAVDGPDAGDLAGAGTDRHLPAIDSPDRAAAYGAGSRGAGGVDDVAIALGWLAGLRAGVDRHRVGPAGVWLLLCSTYAACLQLATDSPYADVAEAQRIAWDLYDALTGLETAAPAAVGSGVLDPPQLSGSPAEAGEVFADALLGGLRLTRDVLLAAMTTTASTVLATSTPAPTTTTAPLAVDGSGPAPRTSHGSSPPPPITPRADAGSGVADVGQAGVLLAYARALTSVDHAITWLAARP